MDRQDATGRRRTLSLAPRVGGRQPIADAPVAPSAVAAVQKKQLVLASMAAGALMFAMNMLVPLVPLAALNDQAGALGVGIAVGAAGLLPLVLALPAGPWSERLGPRRVVLPSILFALAGTATMALDQRLFALAAGQALQGLGQYGATLGLQTFVANLPGPRTRNETFAVFGIANSVGSLVAPFLAGLLADRAGMAAGFWTATALVGLSAVIALALDRRLGAGSQSTTRTNMVRAARDVTRDGVVRLSLGSTAGLLFADSVSKSFLPVFLQQMGLSAATIGLLISLRGLASLIVRPTIGAVTRTLDRWWLVLAAMASETVGTLIVPVLPVMPVLVAGALLCGAALGYNQPLGMATVSDRVPRGDRSTVLAIRLGSNRLAGLVGPLLFGVVAAAISVPATFWVAALVSAVSAVYVATFQRKGGEAAVEVPARPSGEGLGAAGGSPGT